MTDADLIRLVRDMGLGFDVDLGNVIGGPFIPDGTVRIYETASNNVIAQGPSLEEAYASLTLSCP